MSEMNRSEKRIYNLQLSILKLRKWDKILAMEWGKEVVLPRPRTIELNGRIKSYDADIGPETIRVSKDFYKTATPKALRETLRHELAHAFLMDNNIPYKHNSKVWNLVTLTLGVRDITNYEWRHICQCGSYIDSHHKKNWWLCPYCGMKNITKREYNKLSKVAAINSKLCPVNIDRYQVFKDIKRRA